MYRGNRPAESCSHQTFKVSLKNTDLHGKTQKHG